MSKLLTPLRRSILSKSRPHCLYRRWINTPPDNNSEASSYQQPIYNGHIPISGIERTVLTVGSAITALRDPLRGDMVATLGETTGKVFLKRMRDGMLSTTTGRQILRERPSINTNTLDFTLLRQECEPGTFGHAYISWLDEQGVTPDTRLPVHFVDDEELAYVMQRYREIHDFFHTLTGLGVTVEEELALKWFEWTHTGLPMTMLSSIFGPLRLSWTERYRLYGTFVPWALQCAASCSPLMNVYYERHFYTPLDQFRQELGIIPAPPFPATGQSSSL
ncbi:ubiquinone biosynthesis protein Coq4 [Halteromyces radiatus]|uniref:ubiquinone biosynthesis protein Coq4 n=1 Tax=Halteromyces radiatus TaxID=101107 RepID=UPI00221E7703|nr:ubiquinone biosynthesis protein Coq4 [Halteromyces radiatus]KAI8097557.1 ubiquinone biosynthesis protein Coq4 [Halteromyces radiatus]